MLLSAVSLELSALTHFSLRVLRALRGNWLFIFTLHVLHGDFFHMYETASR